MHLFCCISAPFQLVFCSFFLCFHSISASFCSAAAALLLPSLASFWVRFCFIFFHLWLVFVAAFPPFHVALLLLCCCFAAALASFWVRFLFVFYLFSFHFCLFLLCFRSVSPHVSSLFLPVFFSWGFCAAAASFLYDFSFCFFLISSALASQPSS